MMRVQLEIKNSASMLPIIQESTLAFLGKPLRLCMVRRRSRAAETSLIWDGPLCAFFLPNFCRNLTAIACYREYRVFRADL